MTDNYLDAEIVRVRELDRSILQKCKRLAEANNGELRVIWADLDKECCRLLTAGYTHPEGCPWSEEVVSGFSDPAKELFNLLNEIRCSSTAYDYQQSLIVARNYLAFLGRV